MTDNFLLGTYECIPEKGMQNTKIYISKISRLNQGDIGQELLYGAGTGSTEQAIFLSKMEALERLANSTTVSPVIVGTYNQLKDRAVNLFDFPQISDSETSFNKKVNPDGLMKWVESVDLINKKITYIPEEYTTLYTKREFNGEGVTNPISTGSAIHQDYERAILSGIYEVIERDGIALTWLLQLPLEQVESNTINLSSLNIFDNSFLGEVTLYNASTVPGITTVCLRATASHAKKVKNTLMFSTDINPQKAIDRIAKELISVTYSLNEASKRKDNIIQRDVESFFEVDEGALYMAHEENHIHFSFLDNNGKSVIESNEESLSPKEELSAVLKILKEDGHPVIVTDMTNRECKENNLFAVKVTIPTLQPISFVHRSRYLSSNRLRYMAEKYFDVFDEEKINKNPLAFS